MDKAKKINLNEEASAISMEGRKLVRMDTEYIAMRRRMSRIRVKCGKHASYEGKYLRIYLSYFAHIGPELQSSLKVKEDLS